MDDDAVGEVDKEAQEFLDAELARALQGQFNLEEQGDFERSIASLQERADVASIVRGMSKRATNRGVQIKGCEAILSLTAGIEG